jgi:hypothetical protein
MQGASGLETLLTEREAARVLQVSLVTVRR